MITSTVLYGSAAWTITAERAQLLKVTQRRMLRKILGAPRRDNISIQGCSTTSTSSDCMSNDDQESGDHEKRDIETIVQKRSTRVADNFPDVCN